MNPQHEGSTVRAQLHSLPNAMHPAARAGSTIRLGLVVLLIAVFGAGAWACIASLSAAVIAPGIVKVEDNRKTVQHREGGIVSAILVGEGEHVQAGHALVQLGDERVAADLKAIAAQLDAETAKAARLQAQSVGAPMPDWPSALRERAAAPDLMLAMPSEQAVFDAGRRALDEQLAMLDRQGAQVRDEIASVQGQVRSQQAAAASMREELRAQSALSDIGFVSKLQVVRLQRGLDDYEAQRHEALANAARARQRLAELGARSSALRSQYRQSAADELPATRTRIAMLEQQLRSAQDAARRQAIVAPVAGTVLGLKTFTVGGVLAPGAAVLDIVPDEQPLIVEARLEVDDVAHAVPGMHADVRLPAYSARRAPLLGGTLRSVSADRMTDPASGRSYYLAQIAIDPQALRDAPQMQLKSGMGAEVFLLGPERTPLQYLIEPIRNSMRRALRQAA
jgi:HlyD family type I secretion membrane fusion protein